MTRVYLSKAAARKMGLNLADSTLTQEARKPRRATTHPSPPPSVPSRVAGGCPVASYEEVVGLFGGTLHRWRWLGKHHSWLSHCSRIQKHHKPEQGEGVRCEACYQEEVTE